MQVSTRQVTLPNLIAGVTFCVGLIVGSYVDLKLTDATILGRVEKSEMRIEQLETSDKETNKKLDTIILMLTDLKVEMANKQDRK